IGQTLPDEDNFLLKDGEKIELANKSHIGLKADGKAVITDSSQISKELNLATANLNKLVVPYGKRTKLTLSDGTEVWLNSGTQLDFPTEFKDKSREIFVAGEIFINVATNYKKPFIVHAGNMIVNVTGTSFNITAYKDELSKTVVLVNGKVNIETDNKYYTELRPNEKIVITEESVTREFVETSEYISWKDGLLEFNSTPMSEVLKKIGRYYNVQFDKTEDVTLNDKTLSGKLFLSNNLDSVMTSISIISSTEYMRNENNITISKK
ncbi:MAG: FecR domain-containing protein, partial [Fermentimonas sp.]|nr:FecR domain-containing protein [Fermentimonas sp.]